MGRLRNWIVTEEIEKLCRENDLKSEIVDEISKNFSNAFYLGAIRELKRRDFKRETENEIEIQFIIERNEFDFKYSLSRQFDKYNIEFDGKLNEKVLYYIKTCLDSIVLKDDDIKEINQFDIPETFEQLRMSVVLLKKY